MRIVADTMARAHLKSVLVRVTVAGEEVPTHAAGESMTGVPATTAMHFRNGARIPTGAPFYEESTFWNPSRTITHGAVQTTNIYDLEATAAGIGSGRLLSAESYRAMVSTDLRGRTRAQPGCVTCAPQTDGYTYGLGIVISGDWLLQNPMFGGYAAIAAYLPAREIAIAVAVTYDQAAFDPQGNYDNVADSLFRKIGAQLAPGAAPPLPPVK